LTPYLVDTNILVRLANRHDPMRPVARQAVRALRARTFNIADFQRYPGIIAHHPQTI
jgi:hypothetical protein